MVRSNNKQNKTKGKRSMSVSVFSFSARKLQSTLKRKSIFLYCAGKKMVIFILLKKHILLWEM